MKVPIEIGFLYGKLQIYKIEATRRIEIIINAIILCIWMGSRASYGFIKTHTTTRRLTNI